MDPNANPAPEAAPVAPAPAPIAPATPTPEVPATPAVPATPTQPTPEQAAQEAEAKEWDDAASDLFPGLKSTKKEPGNEQTKPGEGGKTAKEGEPNSEEKKPDAEPGDGNDAKGKGEAESGKDAEADARAARVAARQSAEQVKAVATDVRSKMFADLPDQLQDADGDAIKTIEDVTKLINPRTGEAFTEEEAGMWLLSAQQQFNQQREQVEKQIEQIADTNIAIKDEADYINGKYGEILKGNTALRDRLWAQFEKTLVKDEASGIITKMPVSLEEFYEIALAPYAEAAQRTAAPAAPTVDSAEAQAKAKHDAEVAKQQSRADRSDIYSPPNDPKGIDPEEREWAEAANEVFGTNR